MSDTIYNINLNDVLAQAREEAFHEGVREADTVKLYGGGRLNISAATQDIADAYDASIGGTSLVLLPVEKSAQGARKVGHKGADYILNIGGKLARRKAYADAYEAGRSGDECADYHIYRMEHPKHGECLVINLSEHKLAEGGADA